MMMITVNLTGERIVQWAYCSLGMHLGVASCCVESTDVGIKLLLQRAIYNIRKMLEFSQLLQCYNVHM